VKRAGDYDSRRRKRPAAVIGESDGRGKAQGDTGDGYEAVAPTLVAGESLSTRSKVAGGSEVGVSSNPDSGETLRVSHAPTAARIETGPPGRRGRRALAGAYNSGQGAVWRSVTDSVATDGTIMTMIGYVLRILLGTLALSSVLSAQKAEHAQPPFAFTWTKGTCKNCKIANWLDAIRFTTSEEAWARGCRESWLQPGAVFGQQPLCTMVHTTDGGRTWEEVPQVFQYPGGSSLPAFSFIDAKRGWIAWYSASSSGLIHTSDGGLHWEELGGPGVENLTFFDDKNGLSTFRGKGDDDLLWRTADGGHHWTKTEIPPVGVIERIYFVNPRTGWMAGNKSRDRRVVISRTSDGEHWSESSAIPMHVESIHDLYFVDANRGWLLAEREDSGWPLYRTNDGGKTWTPELAGVLDRQRGVAGVRFLNGGTGFVLSMAGATHLYSRDDGGHWRTFTLTAPGGRRFPPGIRACQAMDGDLLCSAADAYYLDAPSGAEDRGLYLLRIHPQF
jgi:photosystem II stability/assembly factor-like uncharacterized protein